MVDERTSDSSLVLLGAGVDTISVEAKVIANEAGREVLAYVDEDAEKQGNQLDGVPIMGLDQAAREYVGRSRTICTLGSTQRDEFINRAQKAGFTPTTLVHPSVRFPDTSTIGDGTWIHPGTVIAGRTNINEHVLINRGCLIGHDVEIGSFSTINPGVNIGGCVSIEPRVYIGMGATVRDGTSIGEGSLIGAGAVVVRDVPAHTKVLGVPARIVEEHIDPY